MKMWRKELLCTAAGNVNAAAASMENVMKFP